MHRKFLDVLCCPKTGESLILKVHEESENGRIIKGELISAQGNNVYPIIRGVPRFVSSEMYAESFGYEWNLFPDLQFDRNASTDYFNNYTEKMFDKIVGKHGAEISGKIVAEFGCGPGRFIDIVRKRGACAIGLDMSCAVDVARRNFGDDSDVLIIQGDVLNPPIKKGALDFAFSIGVLHHTPSPAKGAFMIASAVKSGGYISLSVYSQGLYSFYDSPAVFSVRRFINIMKEKKGEKKAYRCALLYSRISATLFYWIFRYMRKIPFIGNRMASFLTRYFFVVLDLPDKRWRVLDVFDAITPRYATTHTSEEVYSWLEISGCENIVKTNWGETSFSGIRKN